MKYMRTVLVLALVAALATVLAFGAGCARESATDDTGNGTQDEQPADGGEPTDDEATDGETPADGGDEADGGEADDGTTDEGDGETDGSDDEATGETITVSLYWVSAGENALGVMRELPYTPGVASAAMKALLAGPTDAEKATWPAISTAIPEGSELLGLTIEDGVATVDLSEEFESGGGTFSVTARLAQVVYTLEQFETIDAVEFWIEGEPVEVFSSEGIILDGPQTLDDFDGLVPIDA